LSAASVEATLALSRVSFSFFSRFYLRCFNLWIDFQDWNWLTMIIDEFIDANNYLVT
jgi:hypothetical protein